MNFQIFQLVTYKGTKGECHFVKAPIINMSAQINIVIDISIKPDDPPNLNLRL